MPEVRYICIEHHGFGGVEWFEYRGQYFRTEGEARQAARDLEPVLEAVWDALG